MAVMLSLERIQEMSGCIVFFYYYLLLIEKTGVGVYFFFDSLGVYLLH